LSVIQEAAARKIASVRVELAAHADRKLATAQIVYGADVVETATSDETARRRVGAGHHPRRPEGNSVNLVGGERIPN